MNQPSAAPPYEILVVDDEPDLRTLYELTLLREGYRVEAAQDLREARAALEQKRFHALITDMRLPDGLGMALLRQVREQQRTERCVVITAYGSADNAVESLKAGAFDSLRHDRKGLMQVFDQAVDSLLAAAFAKVMSDTTLGGLCGDLFPAGVTADFDADGEQTACITLHLEVQHRTSNLILE